MQYSPALFRYYTLLEALSSMTRSFRPGELMSHELYAGGPLTRDDRVTWSVAQPLSETAVISLRHSQEVVCTPSIL